MTQSKIPARLLTAIGAAIAALALLAPAASATEPAEGFERFAGCPSPGENSEVSSCQRTVITGGHFQMGSKDVPIENEMVLVGGTNSEGGGFVFNSKGGLTPVKQKVPGGVIGLTGLTWLLEFFGSEALTLYATTELAGTLEAGLTLELPIKVHLTNPAGLLGSHCYVGSDSGPITLSLTTGTTNPPPPNESITGAVPTFEFGEPPGVGVFANGTFVDNSFAAPGANGCKLYLFGFIPISINGLVNSQSGLPSAAGTNETTQDFDLELVDVNLVYPPEP